jgi:hypothetical protein
MLRTYNDIPQQSMVTVSDGVGQGEYATNPDLWNILDSSDEEDADGPDLAVEGKVAYERVMALPAKYELDEDGAYRTPADMRAAYHQLRHALSHPGDFERQPKPRVSKGRVQPSRRHAPQHAAATQADAADGSQANTGEGLAAERLASMEAMLQRMKERASSMESDLATS